MLTVKVRNVKNSFILGHKILGRLRPENMVCDCSGNGNHGTIHGATWVDGKFGKALRFDGVDDYVEVSSSDTLTIPDRTELTVTAWVKRNELSKYHTIVSLGGWNRDGWTFRIESNNKLMFIARFTDGTNSGEIEGGYIDTDWHFVTVVYDGRVHLYVDSEEVATSDYFGKVISGRDFPLKIGVLDSGRDFFNGIIDEVMIWNRALTEEEVQKLYNMHAWSVLDDPNLRDGLVLYLPMEDNVLGDFREEWTVVFKK